MKDLFLNNKLKFGKLIQRILLFLIILCIGIPMLICLLFPSNLVSAQVLIDSPYRIESMVKHYRIMRDGRIKVYSQIDIQANSDISSYTLQIPYIYGQNLYLDDLYVGTLNTQNRGMNFIKAVDSAKASNDTLNSYDINERANLYELRINTAFVEGSRYRILLNYTFYGALEKYPDVALSSLTILEPSDKPNIDNLTVAFSFESIIFIRERQEFRLFEHHSLKQVQAILNKIDLETLQKNNYSPTYTSFDLDENSHILYAKNVLGTDAITLNIMFPSEWIPFVKSEQDPDNTKEMKANFLNKERNYITTLKQKYLYQVRINDLLIILLILFALICLALYILRRVLRKAHRHSKAEQAPDHADAAVLAYLDKRRINSRVLMSIIYQLISKGYLRSNQNRLKRVNERLLPDISYLTTYERFTLHWIWQCMSGEEDISFRRLYNRIGEGGRKNIEKYLRLRNSIDMYCINAGWVTNKSRNAINITISVLGIIYMSLAMLLKVLGDYYWPLVLLLPGIILLLIGLSRVKFTTKGYKLMREADAYRSYLAGIDKFTVREIDTDLDKIKILASREVFQQALIYAIALDASSDFLQGVKYFLPMKEAADARLYSSMSFSNIELKINNMYKDNKDINTRGQRLIYMEMNAVIERRLMKMQQAINNLEVKILFPDKEVVSRRLRTRSSS